jgi:hypothetical protein
MGLRKDDSDDRSAEEVATAVRWQDKQAAARIAAVRAQLPAGWAIDEHGDITTPSGIRLTPDGGRLGDVSCWKITGDPSSWEQAVGAWKAIPWAPENGAALATEIHAVQIRATIAARQAARTEAYHATPGAKWIARDCWSSGDAEREAQAAAINAGLSAIDSGRDYSEADARAIYNAALDAARRKRHR